MKKVFILIISLFLVTILAGCGANKQAAAAINNATSHTPVARLVNRSQNLVNATITVSAGNIYDQSFIITAEMQKPNITGSFRASGGSGNDISVLVLSDMDFTNWNNGHESHCVYQSGTVTVGQIDTFFLVPGKYHLVFSNKFSVFTSKNVATNINIAWTETVYDY